MIGEIETKKVLLNKEIAEELRNRYISIDVETTGLNPFDDYITEIGLVLFENGSKTKEYSSLIHINGIIPPEIAALTGITNEMLRDAKSEEEVYKEVIDFLGDAINGDTMLVAHNASFDLSFLANSLKRYGYFGTLRYVDTLNISRSLIKGLFNYKQDTVATYFNIVNERAHRALTDSIVCGKILYELLKIYYENSQTININTKYDDQFEVMIRERGVIYYRFNKIQDYIENGNKCTCNIMGANMYKVSLEIKDTLKGECNCLYYTDNHSNCKHIYALLLKYLSTKKDD